MSVIQRKRHHFGILEDLKHYPDGDVPGSALLDDHDVGGVPDAVVSHLKKGTGRFKHVVLQPQPSDDMRDPLNWPRWKKEGLFWTLCYMSGLVGAVGPLISTGYATLAPILGVSEAALVTATNSDLILALGCIMIFFAPIAVKVGRRPCYLLGGVCLFVASIGCGATTTFNGLKIGRIFTGFGMAPFEALVVSTIGDIYFVHERGVRTAIWGFCLLGGINVTPIVNGKVIDSAGYKTCFWIIAGCFGAGLVATFLFVPETAFDRSDVFDTDAGKSLQDVSAVNAAQEELEKLPAGSDSEKANGSIEHVEHGTPVSVRSPHGAYHPPKSFTRELLPYSGYWGRDNFFKLCLRPFPFFCSPAVVWAFLTYGLTTCWLVVLSILSSIIFSATYDFDATSTGYVSIGPLVATLIVTPIAGPLTDWIAVYMARHNHGRFEPEFRLLVLIPMFVLEVAGFGGWAGMVKAGNVPWIGPVMMYSLINAGQGIGSTAIVTYMIDVHRKHTPEAFAVINLAKNLCLYGISSTAVYWIQSLGISNTFGLLAGLTAFCILTTIPMYTHGKRVRSWVARHEALYMAVESKF